MRRRYRDVMRELVDAVVSGMYPEGTWLPSEQQLATQFGCSRGVTREALRGLDERGLIDVQPARGQRIRQRDYWDLRDPDVLRACIAHGPESATLAHAIDARSAVESEAARRAIRHATDVDLRMLAGHVGDMRAALDASQSPPPGAPEPFVLADIWFHRTLALLSDNEVLARLVDPIHAVLAHHRHTHAPHRQGAVIRHHLRILEGLSARDPEIAVHAIETYGRALTQWLHASRG
jgi:DNA-binding FadR family transcriptional regulator